MVYSALKLHDDILVRCLYRGLLLEAAVALAVNDVVDEGLCVTPHLA